MEQPAVDRRDVARLRGTVIRSWRVSQGFAAHVVAERVGRSKAWMSMLESGARGERTDLGASTVRAIATAMELDEQHAAAFVDMVRAVPTVRVLPARTNWSHNFVGRPGPAWLWIRPERSADGSHPRVVGGSGWWGEALQGQFSGSAGPNGILIHVPTTVPNPPVEMTLNEPGWVEFGRGVVPDAVLAEARISGIDARSLLHPVAALDPDLDARDLTFGIKTLRLARDASRHIGVRWALLTPHLGMLRPRATPHAIDGIVLVSTSSPALMEDASNQPSIAARQQQLWFSGAQVRDIREARGLTRKQVAAAATSALGEVVTAKNIEYIEASGRIPRPAGLMAFLDRVYRLDGRLGVDVVYESPRHHNLRRSQHAVHFPAFYVGPIWVKAWDPRNATAVGLLELVWSPWRRRQRLRSGVLLTSRKAQPGRQPLIVRAPEGWLVQAGTGVAPTATDINHGWYPVSLGAILVLLRESAEAVLAVRRGGAGSAPGADDPEADWVSIIEADEPDNLA